MELRFIGETFVAKTSRLVWSVLLLTGAASAQPYTISTLAGGGPPVPTQIRGADFPLPLDFNYFSTLAADGAGNAYFECQLNL